MNHIEDCNSKFLRWTNDYYSVGNVNSYKWAHVGCSICAIHNLAKMSNLVTYKVVGRGYRLKEKIFQVQLVSSVINMVKNGSSIEDLKEYMKLCSGEKTFCQSRMHCIMRGYSDGNSIKIR